MDQIVHALLEGEISCLLANSTETVACARETHGLSPVASAALGRTMTACALLAAAIKIPGASITATVSGDGPIGRIVCVARPGAVKGYVGTPGVWLAPRGGKLDVSAAVGRGTLSVARDMGFGEPFCGQVSLQSGEIAEDFAYYLAVSEQQETALSLGVRMIEAGVLAAGGVLCALLPGAGERTRRALEACAPNLADISARVGQASLDALLPELFPGMEARILASSELCFRCDCSRAKARRALAGLGRDELCDMIESDGGGEVTCHFCNARYAFGADELRLLADAPDDTPKDAPADRDAPDATEKTL